MDTLRLAILYGVLFSRILSAENTELGSTIPDLKIKLLNGNTTTIHEMVEEGPLMIDFWATWCVPCKRVMKYLDKRINLA